MFLWAAVAVTVRLTAFLLLLSDNADPIAWLLDIVRIGLSVGAGTGGLFALWLEARRQRLALCRLAPCDHRFCGVRRGRRLDMLVR